MYTIDLSDGVCIPSIGHEILEKAPKRETEVTKAGVEFEAVLYVPCLHGVFVGLEASAHVPW